MFTAHYELGLRISEQTAIISLYSTDWVFITEAECVYSAVRAGPLCIIMVNISLYRDRLTWKFRELGK